MNVLAHPIQTAADVLTLLEQAALPATTKRDMKSAITRICTMIGCPPAALKMHVPALRKSLGAIRPARHGIEPRTFANIRSRFVAALVWAGTIEPLPRGTALKDPVWSPLATAIAGDARLENGLACFINWCATKGLAPALVDDAVLQQFLHWLENRTLHPRPQPLVRRIPPLWAEAQGRIPGWPAAELTPISFRKPSPNLRWEELPPGLRADAEAYLNGRANPDLFADDPLAPTRPLEASTLRQDRVHIRLAASILLRNGIAADALDSMAGLVTPDAMKTVLRHYHEQAGGKPNAFAVGLGTTLIHIARYHVRVSDVQLVALKKIASKLPKVPFDMTVKNKALLAELENEEVRARLLCLPEVLMREVKVALRSGGRFRFVDAQVAAAVELLLTAPLRPQNLITLNWTRNFREPQGPNGVLLLHIPKAETKTKKRDLVFELPPELAETIRWYRREILPRLGGDPNGDLFVSEGGQRKGQDTIADQIINRIEKQVGIHMTPHQFRHLAAFLYLEGHPEDFRTVTDLLGHSFAKTTLIYAGVSSRRASVAYNRHVIELRQQALRRRHRKPKK